MASQNMCRNLIEHQMISHRQGEDIRNAVRRSSERPAARIKECKKSPLVCRTLRVSEGAVRKKADTGIEGGAEFTSTRVATCSRDCKSLLMAEVATRRHLGCLGFASSRNGRKVSSFEACSEGKN